MCPVFRGDHGVRSGVEQRGLRGTSPLPERRWGRPAVLPTASRWGGGVRWGIRRNSSWGRAVLRWHRLPGGGGGEVTIPAGVPEHEMQYRRTRRGGPTPNTAQPLRPHRYITPSAPPGRSAPHGRSVYSRAARTTPRGGARPGPHSAHRPPRRGAPQAAHAAAPAPPAPPAPRLRRRSPPTAGCASPRPSPRSPPGSAVVRPGAPRLAERLKGPAGRAFPPSDAAARAPSPARRSPARRSAGPGGRGGGASASGVPPAALPWKRRTAAAEGHKGRRGGGGLRGAAPWRRRWW